MHFFGFGVTSMSNMPTDGLRWVNKGSAPNVLMVNFWFTCWAIASTCNMEQVVLSCANAVNVSASPVETLTLERPHVMTAGFGRK